MARPHPHRARSRPISQRGVQVPVDVSTAARRQLDAPALSAFTRGNMAEAARRFELVADAAARPGLVVDAVGRLASGRRAPTCWPAIRRSSRPISSAPPCTAAPSTA